MNPPPARFTDLVAAEWIKLRSLRSTPWLLGLVTAFVIGAAAVESFGDRGELPPDAPPAAMLMDAFSRAGFMTLMLVAAAAGAVAVVSEYGSGMIRTTTVAVPARGSVLLAKAVVVTAVWTVVGLVASTVSYLVARAVLGAEIDVPSLTDAGAARAYAACVLVAPVCALIGLGAGVLIRHSGTTMVTVAVALLMLPTFFATDRRWTAAVHHAMVFPAWGRLVDTWPRFETPPGFFRAEIGPSWAVYGIWPLVMITLAVLVIRRRDV
ncbi:ABC transporter permease [Streptomyces sp. RFCAC02]|uniref:ABC transporter permease n=1 Tax=Streptomyces sp. RFCAC02 TaxID=2499143 RepID=UPI001022038F|nr:ABC transporter permease [Streptomyces sp. RFCAC02]